MSKKIQSKTDIAAKYQQAIHGVQTYLPGKSLVLDGKPVTSEAVVGLLQLQIDTIQASAAAHTAWLQAVAKERATPKASVIGAAKNLATRKARNTMGSKQRLGITGVVPRELTLALGVAAPAPRVAATPAQAPAKPAETVTTTPSSGNGPATK